MPTKTNRLLVVVKLQDGVMVLQTRTVFHEKGRSYRKEAKMVLTNAFGTAALHMVRQAVKNVNQAADYDVRKPFPVGDDSWHPVCTDWSYCLGMDHFVVKHDDFIAVPLEEYPFREQLEETFSPSFLG